MSRSRRHGGFTLIEILVSVGLSMVVLSAATAAVMQMRTMARRVTARMDLVARAETLSSQFSPRIASLMQHAALVIDARPITIGTRTTPGLRIAYMRGKEQQNDFQPGGTWFDANADAYWELWEWRQDEGRIYQACTPRSWSFTAAAWPAAAPASQANVPFMNFPRPRRTLPDPDWTSGMDDNQLYPIVPRAPAPGGSLVHSDDLGDWGMLMRQQLPVADGVTALAVQVVSGDGTVRDFIAGSPAVPWVVEGAWMDGRVAVRVRPILLRLRMTLADQGTGVEQVYSFTFRPPSLAGN